MRILIIFICACCIVVTNGRALNIGERKKIDGKDNYG